jgi:hypothetical protein
MVLDPLSALAGGFVDVRPAVGSIVEGTASAFAALLGGRSQTAHPPATTTAASPASQELLRSLPGQRANSGVQLNELRALTDAAVDRFHEEVGRVLAEHGLAPQRPYTLESDEFGRLTVGGAHPHKDAIEAALAAEPELAGAFTQIAASANLLRAANRQRSDDVSDSSLAATFRLRMQADGAEIAFT